MQIRNPLVFTVILIWMTAITQAVIPGRWEKVQLLRPGSDIILKLHSGDRMECTFLAVSDVDLTIMTGSSELKIPKSEVLRIEGREKVEDSNLNGSMIGLGAGAGGYLAAHAILCCAPDQGHDAGFAALLGGIGALVGYLIDDRIQKRVLLYRAP